MKISLDSNTSAPLIRAYDADHIMIRDQRFERSLIVSAQKVIDNWRPQKLSELTVEDFEQLAQLEPEIVLLGTGASLCFPPTEITRPLFEKGIGLEVMDTGAACRTYNILITEGRTVAAALLLENPTALDTEPN